MSLFADLVFPIFVDLLSLCGIVSDSGVKPHVYKVTSMKYNQHIFWGSPLFYSVQLETSVQLSIFISCSIS